MPESKKYVDSIKSKVLSVLKEGNQVTGVEIVARIESHISVVEKAIHQLRLEGEPIYTIQQGRTYSYLYGKMKVYRG